MASALIPLFLSIIVLFANTMLSSIPLYLFWNWTVPEVFGLPELTLFQAIGINIIASILFNKNPERGITIK